MRRVIPSAACFLLFGLSGANAQKPAGGIVTGHIRGPADISVPGATVRLLDPATGREKVTWSDDAGNYTLASVEPGTYRLEVSLIGFRSDVREPVPLAEGKTLKVNVALVLAATPQDAGGAARGNGAQPSSSEMGNFRGFDNGFPDASGAGSGTPGTTNVRFSEMGGGTSGEQSEGLETDSSSSVANSFLLSGGTGRSAGDEEGQWRDRAQQFQRMRESQSAPGFGGGGFDFLSMMAAGGGGAWMNRRPTVNRVRGNFSDRYSNSVLDARSYSLNAPSSPQISTFKEQVGLSIGGPLTIPGVYHGRDRTTFFVHANFERDKAPFDTFATVPTIPERGGNFSETVIASGPFAGTTPIIYDPSSNPSGPRNAFPGNQLPSLDPAAQGLLAFIPLPNLPGSVQNFHLRESLPSTNGRLMGRIGHRASDKDNFNIFYFVNESRAKSVSSFPAVTRKASVLGQNLNFGETHTFSPRAINNLVLNYNRQRNSLSNPFAFNQDIAAALGIQGVASDPRDWGLPLIQFTNFTGLNDALPSLTRNQTFRAMDFFIRNAGKHSARFGGELRRVQLNTLTDPDARGTFTFSGFTTSDFTTDGFPVPGTGFDFADFLLGLPQATSVRFGASSNYLRSWVAAGFIQDDWRATPSLTLNYGLRYEYFAPFVEKYGRLSDLAIGPNYSSVSPVTPLAPAGLPASLLRGDANNLAPRVGIAFRPSTRRPFVLRAGFSVFYDGSIYSRLVPNLVDQPPFAEASTLLTSPTMMLTLENGFPALSPTVATNTYAVDPNFHTPYAETWNLTLEDEFARNWIFTLGYVGTKGTKLDLLLAPNRAPEGSPLTTQDRRALQDALLFTYETSGASSIYHGLRAGLRRQYRGGFSFSADYTFSKSIDDAASVGGAGRTVAQNALDLKAERGLSVFDLRHRVILNHSYEFPFGDRRRFLNHGGNLARVLGGWQVSGATTVQTGQPLTARILGNLSNNSGTGSGFSERAEATGWPIGLPRSFRTTLDYFNTAAFTLPPPGEFGNAGRNTIPGPGMVNFSTSLDKQFTFSREKGVRGDFRVEASNLFNTPNYSGLATVVNAVDFGRVTSVRAMRTISASLRLRF